VSDDSPSAGGVGVLGKFLGNGGREIGRWVRNEPRRPSAVVDARPSR
jgi:hypothetical protein